MSTDDGHLAARLYHCARAISDQHTTLLGDIRFSADGFRYENGGVRYESPRENTSQLYVAPEVANLRSKKTDWTTLYGAAMCLRAHFEGEERLTKHMLGTEAPPNAADWDRWLADEGRQVPSAPLGAYGHLDEACRVLTVLTARDPRVRRKVDGLQALQRAVLAEAPDAKDLRVKAPPGSKGRPLRAVLVSLILIGAVALGLMIRSKLAEKSESDQTDPAPVVQVPPSNTGSGGGTAPKPENSMRLDPRNKKAPTNWKVQRSAVDPAWLGDTRELVVTLDLSATAAEDDEIILWPASYWTGLEPFVKKLGGERLEGSNMSGDEMRMLVGTEWKEVAETFSYYRMPLGSAGPKKIEFTLALDDAPLADLREWARRSNLPLYRLADEKTMKRGYAIVLARLIVPGEDAPESVDILLNPVRKDVKPPTPPPVVPAARGAELAAASVREADASREISSDADAKGAVDRVYLVSKEHLEADTLRLIATVPRAAEMQTVRIWPAGLWRAKSLAETKTAGVHSDRRILGTVNPSTGMLAGAAEEVPFLEATVGVGEDVATIVWSLSLDGRPLSELLSWAKAVGQPLYARPVDQEDFGDGQVRVLVARVQLPGDRWSDVLMDVPIAPAPKKDPESDAPGTGGSGSGAGKDANAGGGDKKRDPSSSGDKDAAGSGAAGAPAAAGDEKQDPDPKQPDPAAAGGTGTPAKPAPGPAPGTSQADSGKKHDPGAAPAAKKDEEVVSVTAILPDPSNPGQELERKLVAVDGEFRIGLQHRRANSLRIDVAVPDKPNTLQEVRVWPWEYWAANAPDGDRDSAAPERRIIALKDGLMDPSVEYVRCRRIKVEAGTPKLRPLYLPLGELTFNRFDEYLTTKELRPYTSQERFQEGDFESRLLARVRLPSGKTFDVVLPAGN